MVLCLCMALGVMGMGLAKWQTTLTASGGVSGNQDIRTLRDMGLYAAIIGKAWYAGKIDLSRAVADAGEQEVAP